jgi:ADP-ribose pyrophosphatase YjhB (NUDIX family)
MIDSVEARLGRPREAAFLADYGAEEFASLTGSMRDGRNQDCTILVRHDGRVAMIRKAIYPSGCFRAPGGSPAPGEDLVAAAAREALEELGVRVGVERYLLRAHVTFRCGAERVQWITHVFSALAETGTLAPRDRREVAEARWFSAEEFRAMSATLAAAPLMGLRYRGALQDVARAILAAPA